MDEDYFRNLKPKKDPIRFMVPGRCTGLWIDKDSKGCGHVVRINYMHAPRGSRRGKKAHARYAGCPICGTRYPFAFYKLKGDDDYKPKPEEEQDIRLLFADVKRMAEGKKPSYEISLEERVKLHSLAPPREEQTS